MNIVANIVQTIKRAIRGQSANKPNKRKNVQRPAVNVREEPRTIIWTLSTGYCRVLEVA